MVLLLMKIFLAQNLHGPIFGDFFATARQDRYSLICGLHKYDKLDYKSTGATRFGGRRLLTEDSTICSLFYLCFSLNFIDMWLEALANTFAWIFCAYQYNME